MSFYWDLHIHTKPESQDAFHTLLQVLNGLHDTIDGILVTNHNCNTKINHDLTFKYDIQVFEGIEITSTIGHLLLVGLREEIHFYNNYPIESLIQVIKDHDVICISAHPYAEGQYGLSEEILNFKNKPNYIHALEINGKWGNNDLTKILANKWALPLVGGSDAHKVEQLNTSVTIFQKDITNIDEMIAEIKNKKTKTKKI